MDARGGQKQQSVDSIYVLAMFVGQIGISVRKADALWPGIWFRCAAHFKTRFFPKESPMKIDIFWHIFSAKLL